MIVDTHGSLAEQAQQLSRMIPDRAHPDYPLAVRRWANVLQQAIKQDRATMTLPDLATRYLPVPTTMHDYSRQKECNAYFEERLQQIERRLMNLEVLIRLQEDDFK